MINDPWLEKWLELIRNKSMGGLVLELGCGSGWDTVDLLSAGCKVIATDLSRENLTECAQSPSHASLLQMDHGKRLPFADVSVHVNFASLHYFSWDVTLQIASELRRCLKTDGILLARFNSTHDYNYGASPTPLDIEPNFRLVGTSTKRFFDEASVQTLLQDWDIQFLEENIIHRYEKPKSVWEVMAVSC